jgi:CelD/BcsL family acetyltransferase involved in cellulose biosynthesis
MHAHTLSPQFPNHGPARLEQLTPESLANDSALRAQWSSMVAGVSNPYAFYQSPEWFDHVRRTEREELRPPLALRSAAGDLHGLALPYSKPHLLPFQVRNRSLWRLRLDTIAFLGCEPLFPRQPSAFDDLLAAALEAAPNADGIYLHSVPTDGFLWAYLHSSSWVARHLYVHVPDRTRRFHALVLPATFEEYLATQFRKKKRYNLKRQLRLLELEAKGDLTLKRIESNTQAQWFADAAGRVARQSWQARHMIPDTFPSLVKPAWLQDLAERELLRAYVLMCGDIPCAMVLGYQAGDVFHYSETSYDERFADFSPGSVLLYLMIADLIEHRPPRRVSFGAGDSRYKAEFANRHWNDAQVILLRRNLRGAVVHRAHACFRGTIEWIKSHSRQAPAAVGDADCIGA